MGDNIEDNTGNDSSNANIFDDSLESFAESAASNSSPIDANFEKEFTLTQLNALEKPPLPEELVENLLFADDACACNSVCTCVPVGNCACFDVCTCDTVAACASFYVQGGGGGGGGGGGCSCVPIRF